MATWPHGIDGAVAYGLAAMPSRLERSEQGSRRKMVKQSSGGSGDNGMVIVTTTPKSAAASGSQKRARTPSSPSQGAELLEYSKKQRANNMETQSSTAKSQHERKEMRERISERKETRVPILLDL
uniref:Uncharacterized protein n=1 Tax=Oryza sativa subsp. japonica TaxID=39947 RepID=Q6UUA0_ORYSJ|nr:hypothetical protein OSJNBa0024A05.14 [Oryza sativa Japonica Group]AAQ56460.1 hypothetical protein OSJNBa0074N12.35 [Oryza sativa Japonica Group]